MAETENEIMKQANVIRNRDITLAADGESSEEGVAAASVEVKKDDEPYFVERPD